MTVKKLKPTILEVVQDTSKPDLMKQHGSNSANDVDSPLLPKFTDSKAITDRLCINLPVSDEHLQKNVMHKAKLLKKLIEEYSELNPVTMSAAAFNANYGMVMKLNLCTVLSSGAKAKSTLAISLAPRSNRPFIRFDLKGRVTGYSLCVLRVIAEYLLGADNYLNEVKRATVSTVDMAVDFEGVIPEQCVFDNVRAQKGKMYFGRSGNTETIYIGDNKRSSHTIIYSKNAKATHFNKPNTVNDIMRVEFRYRLKAQPLKKLHKLKDRPIKFSIYDVNAMIESEYFTSDFIDAITGIGLVPVLQRRKKEESDSIKEMMRPFQLHWFATGEVFQNWRKKLKSHIKFLVHENVCEAPQYPRATELLNTILKLPK